MKYIGKRYGRWTVLEFVEKKNYKGYYKCKCDCGMVKTICIYALTSEKSTSCGCYQKEVAREHIRSTLKEGTSLCNINRGLQKNNSSGYKGVCYDKTKKKYNAYIYFQKKHYNLGYFEDPYEAFLVRQKAEQELFKPILDKYKNKT